MNRLPLPTAAAYDRNAYANAPSACLVRMLKVSVRAALAARKAVVR